MDSKEVMKALAGLGLFAALMWLIVWLIRKE